MQKPENEGAKKKLEADILKQKRRWYETLYHNASLRIHETKHFGDM